ncbi:MAG TPA: 50S ribosomal protein L30 [Terriglobia bacterium]
MTKANPATVNIRWMRSAIAFNRKQKEVIRSLGLRRLHHVVERPDTPVIRGLIAKVAHLVEVVESVSQPARALVPEYTIVPAAAAEATTDDRVGQAPDAKAAPTEDAASAEARPESQQRGEGAEAEPGTEESETEGS